MEAPFDIVLHRRPATLLMDAVTREGHFRVPLRIMLLSMGEQQSTELTAVDVVTDGGAWPPLPLPLFVVGFRFRLRPIQPPFSTTKAVMTAMRNFRYMKVIAARCNKWSTHRHLPWTASQVSHYNLYRGKSTTRLSSAIGTR